jgi:lipopolysaccharide/colanic/teichoic acid biosynthesis glycosyltransferase
VKRLIDVAVAASVLAVAAPVMAATAALVYADVGRPLLFRQDRVGLGGRIFELVKFRTMRHATDRDGRLLPDGDRLTRIGKFLRASSLDELPQLVNVLRGQMSLVGPRPPLPREVAGYEPDAIRRLRVRPGLTGLWQVSGRSDLSWEESLRLDLWYVDNWSLVLDLHILFRTARAVLRGSGAY